MSRIHEFIAGECWAIIPEKMSAMLHALELWSNGEPRKYEAARPTKLEPIQGAIAVLPVFGVISRRANIISDASGGTSIENLNAAFSKYLADPAIGGIVLLLDSPGGSVAGVPEFAEKVFNARSQKRIVAIADTLAASAAYWIGSAADTFIASPSADVGSIGVISVHVDESKALEKEGYVVTNIKAGKYKDEGDSARPLESEALAYFQSRVDEHYSNFINAVAKHRGTKSSDVRANYGEGRVFSAKSALSVGMIDKVMTYEDAIAEMTRNMKVKQDRTSAVKERQARVNALVKGKIV